MTSPTSGAARGGRKRDPSRDPVILRAALEELVEVGYDGMTLDAVAARAKASKATVYRRWATKEDLALAALAGIGRPFDAGGPPDTGSLRSDLRAVVDSDWLGGPDRRMRLFAGLTALTTASPRLAGAIAAQITEPYVDAYTMILRRAGDRGELAPGADVALLAQIIPALTTYRLLSTGQQADQRFFDAAVDHVVAAASTPRPDAT